MSWSPIAISPGIVKDVTRYAATGSWVDGSLVRFKNGFPERWAGWQRHLPDNKLDGICRSLHRWSILNGFVYTGIGTNNRFYVSSDDAIYDVTPIIRTVTLDNDPIATTDGSTRIVITDVNHGMFPGNYVIFSGATSVGGIDASRINKEHVIDDYINDDTYAIVLSGANATSTTTGGGNAVVASYLFKAGTEDQVYGGGWGSGTWGEEEWGGSILSADDKMGAWSQDNWGEDLIACAFDGPIFYWDADNPTDRMINIRDLPGADGNAPEWARFIVVSHRDRHLIAFGPSNEFGGSEYAPMTVRWCSQEDIYNWNEADLAGTAGSIPLSRGSRFLAIQDTQREILVWSDTTLYSLQFVGAPDVYIADIISSSADIAGMNAADTFGSTTFWMGRSGFYAYDGRVTKMECPVWDYIRNNINDQQIQKVYCSTNRAQDEVIWFYPSKAGLENDSYVTFDVVSGTWAIGKLARTAWMDMDFQYPPLATNPKGMLLYHEFGMDDGETTPPSPIKAYLESSPIELSAEGAYNKGDRFMFIRRLLPDVTFEPVGGGFDPQMRIVMKMMDKPGGGFIGSGSGSVQQQAVLPIEKFTDDLHLRLRGRSVSIRLESDTLASMWRVGICRMDVRTDGQR